MAIALGSLNTGLPKDIVQQIIAAEKIPVQNMEARKEQFQDKLELLDKLMGLVGELRAELAEKQLRKSFIELKADFPQDLVNVSVDQNVAQSMSHQLEVIQLARQSSVVSSGFKHPEESYLGVGFFSYQLADGREREIYVDSEHGTPRGVAELINGDAQNNMMAQVINDGKGGDSPWRIIISFMDTGVDNSISFPNFYFVDGEEDFFLASERDAQNAKVKIGGFEIESEGNKLADVIPGVTIELKRADPENEFTINISDDTQKTTEKISSFVDKINDILGFITDQNAINAESDTTRTLGGDITLSNLERKFRSVIFMFYETHEGQRRIGDLGITFQRSGQLQLDLEKFEAMLNKSPQMVNRILHGVIENGVQHQGFIHDVIGISEGVLRFPDGMLTSRKKGIQSRIKQIDSNIERKQRLLEQKEKDLKNKFARLEGTISRIKSQEAGLQSLTGNIARGPALGLGG